MIKNEWLLRYPNHDHDPINNQYKLGYTDIEVVAWIIRLLGDSPKDDPKYDDTRTDTLSVVNEIVNNECRQHHGMPVNLMCS